MHPRLVGLALLLVLVVSAPDNARAQGAPCRGVTCSNHGICMAEREEPMCLCDEGYAAEGVECQPVESPPVWLRSSREAALRARIVEVALAQDGRGPGRVGMEQRIYPFRLGQYVAPWQWWCGELVSWVYRVAGAPLSGGTDGGWMIGNNIAIQRWFERQGTWVGRNDPDWDSFEPRPGDFMRMDTRRGGHAAIVRAVEGDSLYTVEGNVDNRVRQWRHDDWRDNPRIAGFGIRLLPNEAPVVSAGEDVEVALPGETELHGSVEDDGGTGELTVSWSQVDGPGEVTFGDPTALSTTVAFSADGVYVLGLTADDGDLATVDLVTVLALPAEVWVSGDDLSAAPPAAVEAAAFYGCSAAGARLRSGALAAFLIGTLWLVKRRRAA